MTNICVPIIIGGISIAMAVRIGSAVSDGNYEGLWKEILGFLTFIAFTLSVRHATILHLDTEGR